MKTEPLPFMPNREELERLLESRIDPDAERFRYFGEAMLSSVRDLPAPTPQAEALRLIMDEYKPTTLDELRACIDAAKTLTP